jgi:hypothetical protein
MSEPYKMPQVHVGQVVLWYHDRTRSGGCAPAIVTQAGDRALGLIMFPTDSRAGTPRSGVRHWSDPDLATMQPDGGVWDDTAETRWLLDVLEHHGRQLDALKAAVKK